MNSRELERYMTENGFRAERDTRHGTFWTDGKTRLLIGNHKGADQHAIRNDFALVKKAIKQRQGYAPGAEVALTHRMDLKSVAVAPPQLKPKEEAPVGTGQLKMVVESKPAKTVRRFQKDVMLEIYRLIAKMNDRGLDRNEIAAELLRKGYTMVDDSEITPNYVSSSISNMQMPAWQEQIRLWRLDDEQKERAAAMIQPRAAEPNPGTAQYQEPKTAVAVATVPQPQRSARVLPQWVLAILTDPHLTSEEKVDMVLALGKSS